MYLLIISPFDQVFEGPFTTRLDAENRASVIRAAGHDAYLMTPDEVIRNMDDFGRLPVSLPEAVGGLPSRR